jgi:hypothetical protein
MFLKCSKRKKNGKEHRSWSIVESRRLSDGRSVQAHVLYLGEINDSQQAAWRKTIEIFDAGEKPGGTGGARAQQMAIFPDDRLPAQPCSCGGSRGNCLGKTQRT